MVTPGFSKHSLEGLKFSMCFEECTEMLGSSETAGWGQHTVGRVSRAELGAAAGVILILLDDGDSSLRYAITNPSTLKMSVP